MNRRSDVLTRLAVCALVASAYGGGGATGAGAAMLDDVTSLTTAYPSRCEIADGALEDTASCNSNTAKFAGADSSARHRVLVRDPFFQVGDGQLVLSANLNTTYGAQAGGLDADVAVHALGTTFSSSGATWNTNGVSGAWLTPGGDFDAAAATTRAVPQSLLRGPVGFDVTTLAQKVSDGAPTPGLLLKAVDERAQQLVGLERLSVAVNSEARTGVSPQMSYLDWQLADGSRLSLNVANGNVTLAADDIDLESDDGRFTVGRFLNGLVASRGGTMGARSRGDFGSIGLQRNANSGSYAFFGPGAADGVFTRLSDGTFQSPEGIDATLTEAGDGTVSLDFHDTTERWNFDASTPLHRLVSTQQDYGYEITGTYGANGLSGLADTLGHTAAFAYDGNGLLRSITDETAAVHRYGYDTSSRLTSYTAPGGALTRYGYDSSSRLVSIDLADRSALTLAYSGSSRAPTAVTATDAAARSSVTTLSYLPTERRTTVTHPDTSTSTYFFDARLVVDLVQQGGAPALLTAGPLKLLNATYSRALDPAPLDFASADGGEGVQRTRLQVDGTTVATENNCCGSTYAFRQAGTLSYDPRGLTEGRHTATATAFDGAANTTSESWTFFVDRTPPAAASGFTGYLDPDVSSAELDWDNGADPALADRSPGSGAANALVRYRRQGGAWSAWQDNSAGGLSLPDSFAGEVIAVEVQSSDQAGNVALTGAHSFTMAAPPASASMTFVIAGRGESERLTWAPPLAAGERLRVLGGGSSVAAVDAGDNVLRVVARPKAADGAERDLDVSFALSGATIVITVRHQIADVEYPVIVNTNLDDRTPVTVRRLARQIDLAVNPPDPGARIPIGDLLDRRPNRQEILQCGAHPTVCDDLYADKAKAEWVVNYVYGAGASNEDGTSANAWKHYYWTGIMTATAARKRDVTAAIDFATAHESDNPRFEGSIMDMHNNTEAYRLISGAIFRDSAGNPRYGTDREICRLFRQEFLLGSLVYVAHPRRGQLPDGLLVYRIRGGLPIIRQTEPCRVA